MSENNEAMYDVHEALIDMLGGWVEIDIAHAALAAARPHILEEAAQIAERAHIDPTEEDDGNILRRTTNVAAAAAIRAAKETGE